MSAETPKHGDLLAALADLPPRKVEKFAIALGVPKNVVEESQINHPKDIYRVKSDALDWWIRNENGSWEAVAKALEAKGIDERNLAERIRSSHGLVPGAKNDETSVMVQGKRSPLLEYKSIAEALPMVTIADMQRSFGKVVANTMKSLESTITTKQFAVTLLALGAYEPVTKKEQAFLDDHEDEIFEAETIPDIYRIIRPYMSFFNPELLAYVIETHGTQANRDDLKEYMSKLNTFCQSIIAPPMEFSSEEQLQSVERREEIRIRLDLSDKRLQRFRDVKSAIAKVLGVKKVALYIDSVEEGSIEVIFLVPQFMVQHLFPMSDVQVKAISSQIGAFKLIITSGDCVDFPSLEGKKLTPKVLQDDTIMLNVLLNCEETKSSVTKQVHFKSLPTTPLEIKKKIEKYFSIPSCVQTLHYQSMMLKDSDQLQHSHLRSGDTFTVDYPIEAECEMTQNVIKWLNELLELLKFTEEYISSPDEEKDLLMSSNIRKMENLIIEGEKDDIIKALSYALFFPDGDKKKRMNELYFHQEGGLDVLMKVYGVLVGKEWGNLGIDTDLQISLEGKCCLAVFNCASTIPFRRQVAQLGGLAMSTTTLLRRQLQGEIGILDTHIIYDTLDYAKCILCSLSELPECQVPLAKRTDVIDQILAMALHPMYDCNVAKDSMEIILNLTQSPETHTYIARRDVVEKMIEICEQRSKMVNEQSSKTQQGKKEDLMVVSALKCCTIVALAQVGLGSPHLLLDSIPPHLLQQILSNLMLDVLKTTSLAGIRQYDDAIWTTFLPYLRYLYKPPMIETATTENSEGDIRTNLYICCCNVLLYGLENPLGRDVDFHLEVLLKEGLLDYIVCLPAVLPGGCQLRARSLVNELGKHIQLQPPSLCTLAKAHIAKTFCGLQPVMEMNSIGEFLYKYFPAS